MYLCVRKSGPHHLASDVPWGSHSGARPRIRFLGHDRAGHLVRACARQRQVLLIWLHGGASQLETWDPKPGTETGGPFRSIETSVPGVRISELMPLTARHMHRMALVRGVNTKEDDHGKGQYLMQTGAARSRARSTRTWAHWLPNT